MERSQNVKLLKEYMPHDVIVRHNNLLLNCVICWSFFLEFAHRADLEPGSSVSVKVNQVFCASKWRSSLKSKPRV